jgi:hypothetical protein
MRLTSYYPTSGYPSLDLYWYVSLTCAVQYGLHPIDHRLLQPDLCVRRLIGVALDDHLIVANEYRHRSWALVPTLPQKVA